MDNPFDSVFGSGEAPASTAAPLPQPSSTPQGANPFDAVFGADATTAPTTQTATQSNPFDAMFGGSTDSSLPTGSTSDPNEGIIGKSWDWLNKPLLDLHRDGATGVEAGVEDFASGLTSPLTIGLTIATAGAGGLLEGLGLDVAKMAAPEVIAAARTVGKVAAAGFTAMQLKSIADESPSFVQAIKNGDTQRALELGTNMLLQGGVAVIGAKSSLHDVLGTAEDATSTPGDQVTGKLQAQLKEDTEQARTFNQEFKKAVPSVAQRGAIQMYAEAGGDAETLDNWKQSLEKKTDYKDPALQRQAVDAIQRAQTLSPDEIAQAGKLRAFYDTDFNEAAGKKLLSTESRKDNYVARARWDSEPVASSNVDDAKAAIGNSQLMNHTKQRIFESTVDGILNNYQPVKVGGRYVFDAADLAADYHRSIGAEIAKRQFVENALNTAASDGRPLAVPGGSVHWSEPTEDNPTAFGTANSLTIPDHPLTKAEVLRLQRNGTFQDMLDSGTLIDKGSKTPTGTAPVLNSQGYEVPTRGRYRYNTDGYNNSIRSSHAWQNSFIDANDEAGTQTSLKSPVAFHPEVFKQAQGILAPERSWLQKNPITNKIMQASSFAKHTLLSLSGFHWVQEGLRGVESGVNPLNPDQWDMSNPKHVALIEAGGLQPGIEGGANSFAEGMEGGGLVSKIPGVGKIMDASNQALFGAGGYIDRLKLTAALKFSDRLKESYPNLDDTTRLKVAGQMANQRFGGLNYLQMGRSPMARDIMRLTLLAPDWLESQVRDAASAIGPFAKLSAFDLGRIALYNFVAAQTLNLVNTGSMHLDTPFGVQSQDGKKVYSVRTMPADVFHALTSPMDFASNRMNPITVRTGVEAITGRDKQGHLRDTVEQMKDLFANVVPIPAQGLINQIDGNAKPGDSALDSVRSAAGVTTKNNPTPAESLAWKLASERSSTGPVPSEQLERHHAITGLQDRLRGGDQTALTELKAGVANGSLAPSDVKTVMNGAQKTRLQAVLTSLPMSDALDVYDRATNAERDQIGPTLLKKMAQFQRTERQKLTPFERDQIDTRLARTMDSMVPTQPTQ